MHNFIIFSSSDRLSIFVNELYSNKPQLHNLNNDLLISMDFPNCGSKVHFVHDGVKLFNNQKQDLYKKLSNLDNKGRVFVCFHKNGDINVQDMAVGKLVQAELVRTRFSHNEGLYQDLNSWYKGEIKVNNVLYQHFLFGIQKYRNRIVEYLLARQLPDGTFVDMAQLNKEQKLLYNDILSKVGNITNEDLKEFKNSLKIFDI